MSTSLISLCNEGRNLAAVTQDELHFPEIGVELLSSLERDHFWYTSRRSVVFNLLRSAGLRVGLKNSRGLDIGCGTGFTAVQFSESGLPTWGVDAHGSFTQYQTARRGAGFLKGDIFSIEPVAEFDFVLLLDVVEHISNDVGFLNQSLKFLKPGGVAIVTVPAFQWLWSEFDEIWGHQRRYTKRTFAKMAESLQSNVSIEKSFYFYAATFVPYMVSRFSQRLKNSKKGIATIEAEPPRIVNRVVKAVLACEEKLIPFGGLPFGSSLVVQLRKS